MHSEIRGVAVFTAVFFATLSHAGSEPPKPEPSKPTRTTAARSANPITANPADNPLVAAPLPSVVTAAPANPIATPSNPAQVVIDTPIANAPNAGEPSGALAELTASKRLAISVLAGAFTLIAALWIGARRD